MKSSVKTWLAGAAALAFAATLAPAAWAGCGAPLKAPASYVHQGGAYGGLLTLVDAQAPAATANPSIVGLWTIQLFDKNDNQIDYGYAEWHADGTELMHSESRPPASGNFCMGVWVQTGDNSFSLNHFAISYDPSTGNINAKVNIREQVTVTGDTFTGHLSEDVYAPDGTTLLQHVHGHIDGERVTMKTTF